MNQINLILQRSISQANSRIEQTLQHLATGMKINTPADSPTGFVLSSNLHSEIRSLAQAMQNTQDGINMLHVGIESLQTQESVLLKLKELAEKAANGTFSGTERQNMQKQANELLKFLYTTKNSTSFGKINIFGSKLTSPPSSVSYMNYPDIPLSISILTDEEYKISYSDKALYDTEPISSLSSDSSSSTVYISSAEEFVGKISRDGTGTEGKTYILEGDIDFSSLKNYDSISNFAGTLIGNGHTVKNLSSSQGLFVSTTDKASIIDLTISDFDITSSSNNIGALVGTNRGVIDEVNIISSAIEGSSLFIGGLAGSNSGVITNSSLSSSTVTGATIVGGLVGVNNGTIEYSSSSGDVDGDDYAGGLAGSNSGLISFSYSTGDVESGGYYTGGFVGNNKGDISSSYATGNITSLGAYTGGFVGSSSGNISTSYSTGSVYANRNSVGGFAGELKDGVVSQVYSTGAVSNSSGSIGGLIGRNSGADVADSFYNIQTSGVSNGVGSGSSDGVMGLIDSQFSSPSLFERAGWSDSDWSFSSEGPHLVWENYAPEDGGDTDFDGYPVSPGDSSQSSSYPTDPGNDNAKTEVVLQIGANNDFSSLWTVDTSLDFQDIWINLSDSDTSKLSIESVSDALETVRSKLDSFSTTIDILESAIAINETKSKSLEAAKSTITDADIASEMIELMKAKKQLELSNAMLIQAGNIQYDQAMTLINSLDFSSSGQEVQNSLNNIQSRGNRHQSILNAIQDNGSSHQNILDSIQNNNIYHQSILDTVFDNNAKNNIMLKMINKYK